MPNPQPCHCRPTADRRTFLIGASAALASMAAWKETLAGPFVGSDFERLVPVDKKLNADWLKSLVARGSPTAYRGRELATIGMPIGGIGSGQLYLGGDGRLWHWDIFNTPPSENFTSSAGPNYAHPPRATSPLEQGFAIRVTTPDQTVTKVLDQRGIAPEHIEFQGQYPIGRVTYRDPELPIVVELEAFSPFVPLRADDSSYPATVMEFTVRNTTSATIELDLVGWLENAVCLRSAHEMPVVRRNRVVKGAGLVALNCSAEAPPLTPVAASRPDLVFEDFERPGYDGWQVSGTAFGSRPVKLTDIPAYQGNVGGIGKQVVNSHATAPGSDVAEKDRHTGKLTSRPFRVERNFVRMLVGGGPHAGRTCVNLVVDERVVRTATGISDNRLRPVTWDVHEWIGRMGHMEIVDAESASWGNIGVDQIVFSDQPAAPTTLDNQPDFGTLAIGLLDDSPTVFGVAEVPLDGALGHVLLPEARSVGDTATAGPSQRIAGAVGKSWKLAPGEEGRATFVVAWHFPALPAGRFQNLTGAGELRRWYGTQFDSALAVLRRIQADWPRLAAETRLWNQTWYDSTLPYWLLDRALQPLACVATATCYRFSNGRFYGYEGTYCCDGTCTHVWHYAQALARIFPELERSTREMVDYGIGFHTDTGAMDYRGEYGRHVAIDGQAGTILRVWREHQMSPNGQMLGRLWPRVKKSLEHLLSRDGNQDGILDGEQYNTLDASWFGEIAWLSSLYLAAVRAGAAMAAEVGDDEFAQRCRGLAETGSRRMVERLFNGEYFIQRLAPDQSSAVNTNDGCHIDQVLGQSWAHQVGLPRVLPAQESQSALRALWKYNFTPDVGPYRQLHDAIPGGRWYAMPGEGGLLMCTWPHGGADRARGDGKSPFVGYFNECMTGFEYQVAAHMIWEGLVQEGLAVIRMIHDRYHAARRNPWNDVECSDHYARAMSSYGVFLAACGYEHHGPRGHLGFAPRISPADFRAPFTTATGWGTFSQRQQTSRLEATVQLRYGQLPLRTLSLELPAGVTAQSATSQWSGMERPVTWTQSGQRITVTWGEPVTVRGEGPLIVVIGW